MQEKNTIDTELDVVRRESDYYYQILKRVVAVLKFLSSRALSVRGHEKWGSLYNGNFMGIIELLSEFDPLLQEHLRRCQNQSAKTVTYLSKTTYEDIIRLMGTQVLRTIVEQINKAPYFSLIVDSTPDLAHIDQLAIVARYCYKGKHYERFLTFVEIKEHSAQYLFTVIKDFLKDVGLPLENIRGQSYDNAANMSGRYNGLQALIKENNRFADCVPCSAHSLNLVGVEAVSVTTQIVNFFRILQKLHIFFSISPSVGDYIKYSKSSVYIENFKHN